ncbi:MAG TPA: Ig-like domain-containing protein, partial [Chthoniobacterales bacterium]
MINATKDDNTAPGVRKQVGNQISYTITISNTGSSTATGVTLTDGDPANTSFVSLNSTPIARDDSYSTVGNIQITVPAANGVLANDNDPDDAVNGAATLSASASATSAQGGNVTMSANGSFIYNPPAGYEGTDTFTYTLTDSEGSTDTATVSINVAGMIWFIDANVGSNGNGRLTSPFNNLASFQAINNGSGNNPAAGDNIFIYESGTAYTGGVTLLNNQKLIGQDATTSLASISGLNQPMFGASYPGTDAVNGTIVTITNASGNGVTLASGNTVRGMTIGNTSAIDIANTAAASVGTLTIADITCNGTGGIFRADSGGALNVTINSASTTSASGNGIQLGGATTGSLTVNGSGTLSGVAGTDVLISGGTGSVSIASGISSNGGGSIEVTGRSGAASTTLSGPLNITGGSGISVHDNTGGSVTFSNASKVVNSGGSTAISLVNNTGNQIAFTGGGLAISTTSGVGFTATGGGTISVTGSNNSINATNATALNVVNTTIGASTLTFKSISCGNNDAGADPANAIVL